MNQIKKGESDTVFTANRLEALADGLFAIVMTLLVLEIGVPIIAESSADAELGSKLIELWPKILIYILSFLVLGSAWLNHRTAFHYITRSDGKLAWMNIIILMFVALVPFSASLLGEYTHTKVAAAVFGVNLLLIMIVAFLMWTHIIGEPVLADRTIDAEIATRRKIMYIVGGLFYIIGIGISFISPIASVCIYALATLLTIIVTWRDSHGFLSLVFVRMGEKRKKR